MKYVYVTHELYIIHRVSVWGGNEITYLHKCTQINKHYILSLIVPK